MRRRWSEGSHSPGLKQIVGNEEENGAKQTNGGML